MIKIIHFSDWHGDWRELPEADLYICTGDMLKNYPHRTRHFEIKPRTEIREQTKWLDKQWESGGLRKYLGSKDAPIVVVRGNHDFVNFGNYFGGEYFEVNENSSRKVNFFGFNIGGFRGIPPIAGGWSDELTQIERLGRVNSLPDDLDIVVSHAPPKGILSSIWGCEEYAWKVNQWRMGNNKPLLCCYGHIHERGGMVEEQHGIKFSNSSCVYNEIYL